MRIFIKKKKKKKMNNETLLFYYYINNMKINYKIYNLIFILN